MENQNLSQESAEQIFTSEPEFNSENSEEQDVQTETNQINEGESSDPSNLILGKFKTPEDLAKAYQELQKLQGTQSKELGDLRQNSKMLNDIKSVWKQSQEIKSAEGELKKAAEKYNKPEYFQDPTFREIYKEAYLALGKKLDTDRLVNLIEGYVSSRIFAHEQEKLAESETQKAINSMSFEKNNQSSITPPKKRLDEMTPKEVDELLDRII